MDRNLAYDVYLKAFITTSLAHVPGGTPPNLFTEIDSLVTNAFAAALGIAHARQLCDPDTKEEFAQRMSGVKISET